MSSHVQVWTNPEKQNGTNGSSLVLVFVSTGYLESTNCLRELRAAHALGRPLVAVRETDVERGGMSVAEARSLCEAELAEALFAGGTIGWFRAPGC